MDTQMLIGSKFETGTETPETVLNPKTEETLLELPEASPDQIDAAVNADETAFKTWSRTTPMERSYLLLKFADRIEQEAESFLHELARPRGKTERALLPIFLGDIRPSRWGPSVGFSAQCADDAVDLQ